MKTNTITAVYLLIASVALSGCGAIKGAIWLITG